MSIINKIKSDKKRAGLLINLILITGGLIPLLIFTFYADSENPYVIEHRTLISKDGTKIDARIYYPKYTSGKHPGVVVAHGYCGNKQYMQPLCLELVKRGFTVVNIDFRGHGSSDGYLGARGDESLYDGLVEDMEVAVDFLRGLGNIDEIGLVGHSMGGSTSLRTAEKNPDKIDATVSIGMVGTEYDFDKISNLLMAFGRFEQIFTEKHAIKFLKEYTGRSDVEIGKRYGSFHDGDACKVVISPLSEHLGEVRDYTIIYETVKWFELAFNGEVKEEIRLTIVYNQLSYLITLIGVVSLVFVVLTYIGNYLFKREFAYPEKEVLTEEVSMRKLIAYYMIIAAIGILVQTFLAWPFTYLMPISQIHNLFAILLGTAIGVILVYSLLILRRKEHLSIKDLPSKFKTMCSTNYKQSVLIGILAAVIFTMSIAAVAHWSSTTTIPTLREIIFILLITIVFFPFLLIKEFYFRVIQGRINTSNRLKEYFTMTGIGILIDNLLWVPIMLLTWGHPNRDLSFLALSLTVVICFSVIQQILVTWVYMYSGRNILGSSIFLSMFYAWMIINFFPFGFN